LDYNLKSNLPAVEGCSINIELYDNIIGSWQCPSIESLKQEVKKQVRYVKTPVYFNDELISVDPETLNWDFEDENAYYLFDDTSVLKIYNLGIYVKEYPTSAVGVGGIVVSKKQLDVNFARNDIQGTCTVLREIQKVLQANKIKKSQKKYRPMSDGERISFLHDFRDGTMKFDELRGKRIFRTTQAKWVTWNMFAKSMTSWTIAEDWNISADKAMESDACFCISKRIVKELGYTGPNDLFFDWLFRNQLAVDEDKNEWGQNVRRWERSELLSVLSNKRASYVRFNDNDYVSRVINDTLMDTFKEDYKILTKLTKVENRIIKVLTGYGCWDGRRICLGKSTVANAWTDGRSYIALDKGWLKDKSLTNEFDICRIFTTLCHELAHDCNTAGSHNHGPDFYERYYDITHRSRSYDNPLWRAAKFRESMKRSQKNDEQNAYRKKQKAKMARLGLEEDDSTEHGK
jgi:hypothetical protein